MADSEVSAWCTRESIRYAQRISPLSIPAILRLAEPFVGHGPLSRWIELGTLVGHTTVFEPRGLGRDCPSMA